MESVNLEVVHDAQSNKRMLTTVTLSNCYAKLRIIFCALQSCIFFYYVYHFLRNIDKTRGSHFKIKCHTEITLHEVIIVRDNAILDQSERA